MKLCNIKTHSGVHLGVVSGRGLVDATAAGYKGTMDELIRGGDLSALRAIEENTALPVVEAPEYADVVGKTGKLLCVGLNYKAHTMGINMALPERPILFSKFADALVPCGAEVELPEWEQSYDYEAELVIVMGKKAWNVSEREALDCVFGYTCGNDLSCRDAQMRSSQWLIGKTMPGFGPCGPCIATADGFEPQGKAIKSYVNGQLRQDGNTSDMIFSCAEIISYASRYVCLEAGDMIFTGTPSGVMLEQQGDKKSWLKKGDRVDVVIEGIGTLTNTMR